MMKQLPIFNLNINAFRFVPVEKQQKDNFVVNATLLLCTKDQGFS
jgi:hypothetical protein